MSSRKMITRTITATTIKSANVKFSAGNPVAIDNTPITVSGKITEEQALKEVRKVYGANAQLVALEEINDVYEISVDDFMKYAVKVEAPAVNAPSTPVE